MFNVATRKMLIRRLQRPLSLKELRGRVAELMKGTRYQSVENFIAALEDGDGSVRSKAIGALRRTGTNEALAALRELKAPKKWLFR